MTESKVPYVVGNEQKTATISTSEQHSSQQNVTLELARALLKLARWYTTDTGDSQPLDNTRAYLSTFPLGRQALREDESTQITHTIIDT